MGLYFPSWSLTEPALARLETEERIAALNSIFTTEVSLAEAPICSISQKSEFLSDW